MAAGSLMTMPILIVNMGGEMVYILEQRLQAQKIPEAKGQKVLSDVVRTMYYPRFIEELFKPQEMYSIQSTRQIFDRLAHSSIMRLNESSMDKLFDLMAMGFKYQIVSCQTSNELVDITRNHLDSLKQQCVGNKQLMDLLDECIRQIDVNYGTMTSADFSALRQSLCSFFQDRKVKVSLFLHDKTQNQDGSIVVPYHGNLPDTHMPLGTVRYFTPEGGEERSAVPLQSAEYWQQGTGARTTLGSNLYEKERSTPADSMQPPAAAAPAAAPEPPPPAPPAQSVNTTAAAVGELNMLASLIGSAPVRQDEQFKLENLFANKDLSKGRTTECIEIDASAPGEYRLGLDSIAQSLEAGPGGAEGEQDDLLDLLDKA
eukprot:TRINITY_DN32048_c0_g1_i1.p1 TRINITY_DN32048_c0_g1~~TRINITY_DN32048_c0_g1_i1.p1  ORF type:complete len:372 (+),score=94.67 TRINITY_DN32048_c0_g1_i1:139-1254(+)